MIYLHCDKATEDIHKQLGSAFLSKSQREVIDTDALVEALYGQMKEYYMLNQLDPYKNRRASRMCRKGQPTAFSLPSEIEA